MGLSQWDLELAWAAGLFEGEGTIGENKPGYPHAAVTSTDKDVVTRLAQFWPYGHVYTRAPNKHRLGKKTQYTWQCGTEAVETLLFMFLPYLGTRRSARVQEVLTRACERRTRSAWRMLLQPAVRWFGKRHRDLTKEECVEYNTRLKREGAQHA